VLVNSLRKNNAPIPERHNFLYRPYRLGGGHAPVTCFFRDDRLSDLIGFEYSKWHGKDAAAHFVGELKGIVEQGDASERRVVSVILDGENAWEYYPYNGYSFSTSCMAHWKRTPLSRPRLLRGSSTRGGTRNRCPRWSRAAGCTAISPPGSAPRKKNRAWDLLCAAKRNFDLVAVSGRLNAQELADATRQLADCEASDWFWWFGDYNPASRCWPSIACTARSSPILPAPQTAGSRRTRRGR